MNRRGLLLVDVIIAAALAALVLVISPGLAITAIIALIVLVVCALSFAVSRVRSRRTQRIVGNRTPSPGRRNIRP